MDLKSLLRCCPGGIHWKAILWRCWKATSRKVPSKWYHQNTALWGAAGVRMRRFVRACLQATWGAVLRKPSMRGCQTSWLVGKPPEWGHGNYPQEGAEPGNWIPKFQSFGMRRCEGEAILWEKQHQWHLEGYCLSELCEKLPIKT